ncbi:hypothetical protein ARMGADRAFT_1035284 [Armillaria gallica]|uniref:Uncharacterized protein n=1 Tax=Armillaria gallica TaxID=47427 RepID=A0A2H3CUL9_ARMGA|nr:hypothetical protein ARMGADRAFT_1035284 [Armillaria gallica]
MCDSQPERMRTTTYERLNRNDDDLRRNSIFICSPTCFSYLRAGNGAAYLTETPEGKMVKHCWVILTLSSTQSDVLYFSARIHPFLDNIDGHKAVKNIAYYAVHGNVDIPIQFDEINTTIQTYNWRSDGPATIERTFMIVITPASWTGQLWGYMALPHTGQSSEDLDLKTLASVMGRICHFVTCNEEIKETQ